MFDIGFQELIIIFTVALLVFGPKKLPELAKTIGKWVVEVKRGVNIAKMEIEKEMRSDEFKIPDEDIIKSLPKDETKEDKPLHEAPEKEVKG